MRNYEMEGLYREETGKVAFQGNYTINYVHWLESKIEELVMVTLRSNNY